MGNHGSRRTEIEKAEQERKHQRELEAERARQAAKEREYQIQAERMKHEQDVAAEQVRAQRELEKQKQEQLRKEMEHENRMRMAQDQMERQRLEMERKAQIAQQQATDRHNQEIQKAKQLQMEKDHQRKMELAEAELNRMKREEQRLKAQHEEEVKREKREAEEKMREQAERAKKEREHLAEMAATKQKETEEKANARAEGLKNEMKWKLTKKEEEHVAAMELESVKTAAQMDMAKVKFENKQKELEGDIKRLDEQIETLEDGLEESKSQNKELMIQYTEERDLRLSQLEEFKNKMVACQSQLMIQYGGSTQKRLELQALMSEIIPEVEHNNQYKWMPPPLWIGLYSAFFALLSIRTGELSMVFNGLILGIILYGVFIYYYFDQGRMLVLRLREAKGTADQIMESERTVFGAMESMTGVKIDVPSNAFDHLSMDTLPKQIADREVSKENLQMLHLAAQKIRTDTNTMYTSREKLLSIESRPVVRPKQEAITDAPSTGAPA